MKIVGLTGSIGMGKSTTSRQLKRMGYPVQDADAVVHQLMERNGVAVPAIEKEFPGVTVDGAIDRERLAKIVFARAAALKILEGIIFPFVFKEHVWWINHMRENKQAIVFLDIPLLYETEWDAYCDAVMVVSAPAEVQRARVLARPRMTEQRFNDILSRQLSDEQKRARADFIINTGEGLGKSRQDLLRAIKAILSQSYKSKRRKDLPKDVNA